MKHAIIGIAHWVFYSIFILPLIINAEVWFFGIKFNGIAAITLHLSIAGTGMILGYFIYKKRKHSLWAGLGMGLFILIEIFVNYLTA